eukprot:IDg14390t1
MGLSISNMEYSSGLLEQSGDTGSSADQEAEQGGASSLAHELVPEESPQELDSSDVESEVLPETLRGAPAHLRDAIRRRQNLKDADIAIPPDTAKEVCDTLAAARAAVSGELASGNISSPNNEELFEEMLRILDNDIYDEAGPSFE